MNSERNGFLPMAIGLVLIFTGIAIWQYNHFHSHSTPIDNSIDSASQPASQDEIVGWEKYENFGYSIKHPTDFILRSNFGASNNEEPGFDIPVKNYFRTKMAVGANFLPRSPIPAEACAGFEGPDGFHSITGNVNSGVGTFKKAYGSDGGAGQFYEQVDYWLIYNNQCYQFHSDLHTVNDAGVFPEYDTPEKITAANAQNTADKAAFFSLIDKVVATFSISK